jgi:hypothetical protein
MAVTVEKDHLRDKLSRRQAIKSILGLPSS